ncbi:MAG TPA: discoidin domain-containing protein [Thermoanaerobaculia bacterium]
MRFFAAFVILMLACGGEPPSPHKPAPAAETPATPKKGRDTQERGNLLNIALGASVVSRTAELTLDQSALRAIDGDEESAWNSPPDDSKQTIVFALPGLTHVEKVGLKTPRAPVFRVSAIQVDSSIDGVNFTSLATLHSPAPAVKREFAAPAADEVHLFAVTPRDIVFLRVTILEAGGHFARLESVQVRGRAVETPKQQPIDGCWSINGFPSSFATDRGRTIGTIGGDHPVSFDGATDGTVYRFVWTSGPDYGFGAIDTAPDGKHLSGLRWYVEPIEFASAESWFGERGKCGAAIDREDVPRRFLQRAGRLPLYGLRFDANGSLNEIESAATLEDLATLARDKRHRLVSREFRMENAAANLKAAQKRLDSLRAALQKRGVDPARFDWQAIGNDSPPRPIETEIQRVLYGVIELQSL